MRLAVSEASHGGEEHVDGLLDTGATRSFISSELVTKLGVVSSGTADVTALDMASQQRPTYPVQVRVPTTQFATAPAEDHFRARIEAVGSEHHFEGRQSLRRVPFGHQSIIQERCYDVYMRTTLTLDDDLAAALKEQAQRAGQPFKQVVNNALRRGLSPVLAEAEPDYEVRPHDSGFRPGVDPLRLNQLNDSLEAADFAGSPPQ